MKALITGASSGIGEALAYELSKRGYDLVLVATDLKKLEHVSKNCKTKTRVIPCDLKNTNAIYDLYDLVKEEDIDLLINNAGFGLFGFFDKTELTRELEMIDVNIRAVHILTKLFLKDFVAKDNGRILNVASSAGFMAGPKLSTYYATKNYVLRLSQAIYEELRHQKSNVKISVLCPGPVNTNFNKVAKGKFNIKGADKNYVAKYTVDKMFKNKLIIIPTLKMKLAIFGSRLIPSKLLLKITYRIQDKKLRDKSLKNSAKSRQ